MSIPQEPLGDQAASIVAIVGAIRVLDMELGKWPANSDKFKALSRARRALTEGFGEVEEQGEEMQPALQKAYLTSMLGPKPVPPPPPQPAPGMGGPPGMGAAPLGPGAQMGGMAPQ